MIEVNDNGNIHTIKDTKGEITMELKKIAERIGIAKYPEAMDAVYAAMKQDDQPACDLASIDALQEEYGLYGDYYELVKKTGEQINADPDRSTWVKVAVAFSRQDETSVSGRSIPVPTADGTDVTAFLPVHILAAQIPESIELYRRRGFPEEEIAGLIATYRGGIRVVENQTGRPGLNKLYYGWQNHFIKAEIYKAGSIQFETRTLPQSAVYLRNKQTRDVIAVMNVGTFHASGMQILGSRGYEDPEGAFQVSFTEDAQNYYGHRSLGCKVSDQKEAFPKSQWELFARPGDKCMSIHIPKGADISPETLDAAFAQGRKVLQERYPEHTGNMIFASSWILDPKLEEILGPDSKITKLGHRFVRYPQRSPGMHVFGNVFAKQLEKEPYENLPEDTSLMRGLKKLYIEGGHIYAYAGLIPEF